MAYTKKSNSNGPGEASHSHHKVYGKPLQNLYADLVQHRKAPPQPEIIRSLVTLLENQGIHYHPRTIKRQLLGNIEYIPEALESAFLNWVGNQNQLPSKKIIKEYQKNIKDLEASTDQLLYVSPQFFTQMADGYLFLHKKLSRRQLALKLQEALDQKNIALGLETLQAALAGKTLKIRKVIEDQLVDFFSQDGYRTKKEIQEFLDEAERGGKSEIEKVSVGKIAEVVDAYLLKAETLSKRQLAIRIKDRLEKKGYSYHLSSIQSVIEGKTRKTKKAILETINEMLHEEGLEEPGKAQEFLESLPESQRQWHHYLDAEDIPERVQAILRQNPSLTRRQLALVLKDDLRKRNFEFSLNTLQYILAGKTQRTRGIIVELLKDYSQPGTLDQLWAARKHQFSARKGRPSIDVRIAAAFQQLQQASPENKDACFRDFLAVREELIKKRWHLKHPPRHRRSDSARRKGKRDFGNWDSGESFESDAGGTDEAAVAYDVHSPMDRLVS